MTPYLSPSPKAEKNSSEWPRKYRTLTIPISEYHVAELSIPVSVTPEEWEIACQFWALIGPVIVDKRTAGYPRLRSVS